MQLTEQEIAAMVKPYIKESKRCAVYSQAVDVYNHLRFHIDGYKYDPNKIDNPYFTILIEKRRPNESENIVKYRKDIYLPKTKQPCFKVLNSLKKIVKSQDWSIDYSKSKNPARVGDDTLKMYCEENYPIFKSLENWLYTLATKEVILDPNGLVYIEPKTWEVENGEKFEPVAKIVKSPNVLMYKEGYKALFKSEHVNTVEIKGNKYDLPVYIFMTKDSIYYIKEIDLERNFSVELMQSELTQMFCFKLGGVFSDLTQGEALYNSFIDPMLPSLDAAARESSDLDAEVVQHIYSTMWYYSGNDCRACSGTGQVIKDGQQTACKRCDGAGRMLKSPYKDIVIGKEGLGENGVPTPPGGYIQKTTDIVTLQDNRIANHIFDALASLNMEFLAQTPLNQSGVAKEVDRDELNNFVYGIAYHLVENVLKPVYSMINELRYKVLVTDIKARNEMLPSIQVPEKYDLLSTNDLLDTFKKGKDSGLDNSIIDEAEVDIINKLFNNQPDVRDKLLIIKELDPLRGKDNDTKIQLFNSGIITKEDYIKSTYINVFVDEAIASNENFYTLTMEQQNEMIDKMVEEKTKELDVVAKVQTQLNPPVITEEDEDEEEN